jgi:glutamine phosphoribosylpyrophosphate amidotransferase
MCGLLGILSSPKKRSEAEQDYIRHLFARLLVESEHRGPYATGAAMMSRDGSYLMAKEPIMASEFVESMQYQRLIDRVDGGTAILMGHTRYPTRGSHLDNRNNHPLSSDEPVVVEGGRPARILLAHNGHISNFSRLFEVTGLRKETQVDSEILLRFAERNIRSNGIDVQGLMDDLSRCKGRLSMVAVSTNRPDQVFLIKGNMPLEIWHHPERRLLAYASEAQILASSVGDESGWRTLDIPPWTVAVVNTKQLLPIRCNGFEQFGGTPCR